MGEQFTFRNPDGSEFQVRGWGNQFSAVFETTDGYTVVPDPDSGFYHFAALDTDSGDLVPSGETVAADARALALPPHLRAARSAVTARARTVREELGGEPRWQVRRRARLAQRGAADGPAGAPPPAATVGDYTGLVLLVEFPDVPATITRNDVDNFCNQVGFTGFGNNGSAYDYFLAVSDGKLRYRNRVAAYHRAEHPRAHYTDRAIPYGTRAQELIKEALDHLKASGFDFSVLSSDSGGFVHALSLFYAGDRVNNWSEGLWPHSWALATPYAASATRTFSDYQITDLGTRLTLRTFCHENGHMVCDFPDLYDYDSVLVGNGVGHYCLMCFGGSDTNPVQVDAYLKNAAGWTSRLTTLTPGTTTSIAAGSNDFLVHRRSATEYFIMENRRQAGRDTAVPDAGLAIWHVDETGDNSNEQMTPALHYELSLEQADNRFDLEHRANAGDSEDLHGGPAAPAFGSATAPNSNWWDGSASGLEIEEISAPGATMTVRTKATGPQWYGDLAVDMVFASHHSGNAWAALAGLGWRQVRAGNPDGVTNMLAVLTEARANGKKVSITADATSVYDAYLL
ncbi:M6 family metalloprotease domain-containing protein [Umezawaea sp.]|uniref:M6 family metalloprotease domain-containing protein n=1 Tax=Umezawaea sp. TaxID=1955258 RepID=UPI002ED2CBC4